MWRWHRWCGPWRYQSKILQNKHSYQSRILQNKHIRCMAGKGVCCQVGRTGALPPQTARLGAATRLAHLTSPTHPPAPLDAPGSTTSSASTAALLSGSAAAAAATPAAATLPAEVGGGVGGAAAAAAAPAAAA